MLYTAIFEIGHGGSIYPTKISKRTRSELPGVHLIYQHIIASEFQSESMYGALGGEGGGVEAPGGVGGEPPHNLGFSVLSGGNITRVKGGARMRKKNVGE